ncbi:MAG: hypothetical protein PVJ36_00340 [Nitrospirota bacterium]
MRWLVLLLLLPLLSSSAFAFNGRANLSYSRAESFEEGEKISTSDRFTQNYFLGMSKRLSPLISYRLSVNASLFDQSAESEGTTRNTYRRSGSAGLDVTLNNPFFRLTSGYIRRENWDTARLKDESRTSRDFYYARLDVVTRDFPSLYLEYSMINTFDYPPVRETDTSSKRYSATSAYSYRTEEFLALYTVGYSKTETDTPLELTRRRETDSYSGSYDVRYENDFWDNTVDLSVEYRGNLGRTKSTLTVGETGQVLFVRDPRVGLHARDTFVCDVRELNEQLELAHQNPTSTDYESPINSINIGSEDCHNIGIELDLDEETSEVDRLFVYVFVPDGTVLADPPGVGGDWNAFWRAFKSETNPPEPIGTDWLDEVAIQEVILHPPEDVTDINPDADNPNVYLFEVVFTLPQQGVRFYKVINDMPVSQTGLQDVFVTEIEAYGLELVTAGETTNSSDFFSQGLNLRLSVRPLEKVSVILNYDITRTDTNPDSFLDPLTGIFKNVFVRDLEEGGGASRISVRRAFGSSVIWRTLEKLTTTFRVSRNEFFDNLGTTDSASNTYLVSLNTKPLPNLDAHLSAIRTESFNFGERRSTNHSLLLTLGTRLYREVRMTTDTGYINSKNHQTGSTTNTEFIRGIIDARVTTKLFTHMTFGLERSATGDNSSTAKDASVIISYRPARLISFSGNFRIRDSEDTTTTIEGISVNWLPVPVMRFLASYQHRNVSPGPDTTDTVSTSVKWNISKSLDVRVSLSYTKTSREVKTESRAVTVNLNGRF